MTDKIKKLFKQNIILLLVVTLIFFLIFFAIKHAEKNNNHPNKITYDYYEDTTGGLALTDIQMIFSETTVSQNTTGFFMFGNSKSTYWIRIPLKELSPAEREARLFIYNPTVAKAVLYLPVQNGDMTSYEARPSGWFFIGEQQDDHFVYPAFSWDSNTNFNQDAYLELFSPFTQNYTLDLLPQQEADQTKQALLSLYGVLFGIFFAVAIHNLFIFLELREAANLYYFFYVLIMAVYQGCLLGIYNVFAPDYAAFFMSNTLLFSLLNMLMAILFFRSFFRTKWLFPTYEKWAKGLLTAVFIGAVFVLIAPSTLVNLYAHSLSLIGGLSILFMAIGAFRKNYSQARFFIVGWLFIIVGVGISFCRNAGWISNNVVSLNIIFLAMALNSLFLSTALVQRVKLLMAEKEVALKNYYEAAELAKSRELAFLQAQIKPHFLYNTLNIIASLCRIDPLKARELLLDLGEYLHHSFDFYPDQQLVPLETELNGVRAFVRIEQARFPNKLRVCYELAEINHLMIPPLILQPLVENAILHGIRKKGSCGTVMIRTTREHDAIVFAVVDDGIGMTTEQITEALSHEWHEGKGVGLSNIHKRLTALYGQGLTIKSIPEEKTEISFRIGKRESNQ